MDVDAPIRPNRFRLYQEAKKIVEARIGFFIHLGIFLSVNTLLLLINLSTIQKTGFWFLWPALLWGAGILVHGCFLLLYSQSYVRRWQENVHTRKAMEMQMGLKVHWALFTMLNVLLLAINVLTVSQTGKKAFWSIWILLGWGIGIAFHTVWVYLNKDHKLKRWKRRKAVQILDSWGDW